MSSETTNPNPTPTAEDPFNVEYWRLRWVESRIGFHKSFVNPYLLKHMEFLTGQPLTAEPVSDTAQFQENSKKTWFVPLCGKTLDIPYLLSQGFRVFGLEAVRQAIEELDQEHSLSLVFDEKTSLFTGANGMLQIYNGDLFACPIEKFGPFDYVWDRGSFIALEYPFRSQYVEMMHRALKNADGSWHNYKYLLETVLYDKAKFGGPPRCVDDEDIKTYYEPWSKVEFRMSEAIPENSPVYKEAGEGLARIFYITPKS